MSGLFVDHLFRPGDTEIEEAGLHEGAVVAVTSSRPADRRDEDLPEEGSLALSVVTGPDAGRIVPLPTNGEYRIGRGPDCHIRLLDPTLSRLHCALQVSAVDTVTVVNLSTTVGTRIAGATITSPEPVAFGTPIAARNDHHRGGPQQPRGPDTGLPPGPSAGACWNDQLQPPTPGRSRTARHQPRSSDRAPGRRQAPVQRGVHGRAGGAWGSSWCSPFTAPCTPCSRC